MNKVILVGRLTRDPEVKYTPSGKVVTTFTLAVDRPYSAAAKEKGEKEADFVPIVVWGNTAEFCGKYLNKGSKILVDGRLQVRSYDAKDGTKKRYVTEVVANFLEALERPKGAKTETAATDPDDIPSSFGTDVGNEDVPF